MSWPRLRTRRLGWILLAAGLLFGVLYNLSYFGMAGVRIGREHAAVVGAGLIGWITDSRGFKRPGASRLGPFFLEQSNAPTHWWILSNSAGPDSIAALPIWMPALVLLLPGAYLVHRTRPSRPGLCPRCRYNLAGLPPNSPCPECGRAPARA